MNFPFRKDVQLSELFIYALRKWYIIFAIVLTAFIGTIIYFKLILTPLYSSTARMYVVNKNSGSITSSELSVSLYLSKDYAEIILDTPILSKVQDTLNGKLTIEQIKSYTTVKNIENTRILEVRAVTPDPNTSKIIVDTICNVSQEELIEIMGLDRIKIIKEGSLSKSPTNSSFSEPLSTILFAAFLLAFLVIYLMYSLNNSISSKEEIEKYLSINILATIPYNPTKQNQKQN